MRPTCARGWRSSSTPGDEARGRSLPGRGGPTLALAAWLGVALMGAACDRKTVTVGEYAPFSPDSTFGQSGLRVLDPGGVDNVNWTPHGIDLEPDGRILVGGSAGVTGHRTLAALRLLEDGSPDPSFGASGIATVDMGTDDSFESIRLQSDGKIVLLGSVNGDVAASGIQVSVARLLADGSPDPSFAGMGWRHVDLLAGNDVPNDAITLSDGRLRLCGQGSPVAGGQTDFVVWALTADGAVDTSFGTGGVLTIDFAGSDEYGTCIPGGSDRLLVYGMSFGAHDYDMAVARILPDGSYDPSFSDGTGLPGRSRVDFEGHADDCGAIALQPDGKIVCAGYTQAPGGTAVIPATGGPKMGALARMLPDGTLDPGFGSNGRATAGLWGGQFRAALVLPDGRIAAGGSALSRRGDTDFALAIFRADGALDTTVGDGGLFLFDVANGQDDEITSMMLDGRGRLLLYGSTLGATGTDIALMRLVP